MDPILVAMSMFAVLALMVAGLIVYLDSQGEKKAIREIKPLLEALARQTAAHDGQIGSLTRAVALLAPADARPTVAIKRPPIPHAPAEATPVASVDTVRAGKSPPPAEAPAVDTAPDSAPRRAAVDLGRVPGETREEWGARIQRAAELAALDGADDEEPEEPTRVAPRPSVLSSVRPTLVGGAEATSTRPIAAWERRRAELASEAARYASHTSAPTLASAGAEDSGPISQRGIGPVERRYRELCAASRAKGLPAQHCNRGTCEHDPQREAQAPAGVDSEQWARLGDVGICLCACDGCSRCLALLTQAEAETLAPPR